MSTHTATTGTPAGIEMRYVLSHADFDLDIDLEVPMRGITGVFGESGAGKTSLLRCIAGLEQPSSGRLVVDGKVWQDTASRRSRPVHQREIGYVFQEPRLFSHLTVHRNLGYGQRRARKRGVNVDFEQIVALLGLENLLLRMPDALSGGEAQRVSIARALLCEPRFVLMDEPLAALDTARRAEILPFLDRLHAELSIPIIYVSHNIGEISALCDQLIVMQRGRVIADGDLQGVLMRTDLPMLAGEEAGSVVVAKVESYDAVYDLSCVRFSGGELIISGRHELGSELRVRVRASDVSLCRVWPSSTTILNILPAVVEKIHSDAEATVLVHLALGSDRMIARITRRSSNELNLQAGDELFAQIKSVAVRNVLQFETALPQ
jgi:molybdate transport system ATP-binding protein